MYCIIESSEPQSFGKSSVAGGGDVYTIHHRDLAAVASDAVVGLPDPTRENVLGHERVVEAVMERHAVLPLSFGTVFRTRDDVVAFLADTHDTLRDVICEMRGKIEFGVQVNWDRDEVLRDLEAESEELARARAEVREATDGGAYPPRVRLGRLVERLLARRAGRYVREIHDALRAEAVASKLKQPAGERTIMDAAFLVERARADGFDRRMHEVARRYAGRLAFRYTGPWPPYNFVSIRVALSQPAARS